MINQKISDIENELKKINQNKKDNMNRNINSVIDGRNTLSSSSSILKKYGSKNSRPVSAYPGAISSPKHHRMAQTNTQQELNFDMNENISIDKGGGTLKRKLNNSMAAFSEQSIVNHIKINKQGIIKNWIKERYNCFEQK